MDRYHIDPILLKPVDGNRYSDKVIAAHLPRVMLLWHLKKYVNHIISVYGDWRILIDGKVESRMNLIKNPIAAEEAKQL